MNHTENRRIGADTQRQRQKCSNRESGAAKQGANGVLDVPDQIVDDLNTAHVAAFLLLMLHPFHCAESGIPRFFGGLPGREFLLDRFSVADAYLATVLNWTIATPIDLAKWPAVAAYAGRMRKRPSVAKALAIELPLYQAEQKRHAA